MRKARRQKKTRGGFNLNNNKSILPFNLLPVYRSFNVYLVCVCVLYYMHNIYLNEFKSCEHKKTNSH